MFTCVDGSKELWEYEKEQSRKKSQRERKKIDKEDLTLDYIDYHLMLTLFFLQRKRSSRWFLSFKFN